jgi:hypothetical protein
MLAEFWQSFGMLAKKRFDTILDSPECQAFAGLKLMRKIIIDIYIIAV